MEGKFSKQFTKQDLKLFFDKLKTYTSKTNLRGCNRLAYTLEDEEATLWLISEMQHYGLTTRTDLVGNVYARLPGKCSELPAVGTGSHIDTVPQGGDYDGVVGVLTGLYALLQYQPYTLKRDIELILFRAEESSRFGFSCIGSKSITGKIDRKKWQQNVDNTGNNVFDIIQAQGYAMADNITNENCELPEHYFDAFVEVHIEQGKVLESQKKRIGIVHGIAAPTRFKVVVEGHADHSGATPMDQRSDALVASAYIITNLQAAAYDELSFNTVGTVGKLDVQPNSMNVIPGNVMFLVDIRGIDQRSISRVIEKFMQSTKEAEHRHHCQITVHSISNESPVKLNNEICQIIDEICQSHAIPSMSIVSGAGHDSMNIADKCPAAMIFIPSQNGVSHHPEEYSQWHDIELSADLLTETIGRLANK